MAGAAVAERLAEFFRAVGRLVSVAFQAGMIGSLGMECHEQALRIPFSGAGFGMAFLAGDVTALVRSLVMALETADAAVGCVVENHIHPFGFAGLNRHGLLDRLSHGFDIGGLRTHTPQKK